MKRKDLLKQLKSMGWFPCKGVSGHGPHEKFCHAATKVTIPVPRSKEIPEYTARSILKDAARYSLS